MAEEIDPGVTGSRLVWLGRATVDFVSGADEWTRLRSPKLQPAARNRVTPGSKYYAGYDAGFVEDLLSILGLEPGASVLDPWNGAGTTTTVATKAGMRGLGFDINPVLVIVGKARLLSFGVAESLKAIVDGVIERARGSAQGVTEAEPLCQWFKPGTAAYLRALEAGLHHNLVSADVHLDLTTAGGLEGLSALAASFYVVLFETVRSFLHQYKTSNPTWVKLPASMKERISLSRDTIDSRFRACELRLHRHLLQLKLQPHDEPPSAIESRIALASSVKLPLEDNSIGACLGSPPYCTRIDYPVLTRPELATLGVGDDGAMRALREATIGTTTMAEVVPEPVAAWGATALRFVEGVTNHSSKASKTYYRRYFVQYFDMMYRSMLELRRCAKPDGKCALVVQDSYYKDLHLDLAGALIEIGSNVGWSAVTQTDFGVLSTMAARHPWSRQYRSDFRATESLLVMSA